MEKLSRDLMIDITSRLPIKYVLRCKSVSKSWEALISDQSFAAAHFDRASTLTPFSNHIDRDRMDMLPYFIHIDDDEDNESSTTSKHLYFRFPTHYSTKLIFLMGSCLGYLCLSRDNKDEDRGAYPTNPMYLFNPLTGAKILLPQFQETRPTPCVYGFGLDASKQECKVVLVFLYPGTFVVHVHTVGRDYSWRTNNDVPSVLTDVTEYALVNDLLITTMPLELNGSIHWIVLSPVYKYDFDSPMRACILSFQLDTEVFGVIPMPEPLQLMKPHLHDSITYALQVCGGCLSIIYSPEDLFVDMWVMADYNISESWVKKYSIQINCMGRRSQILPIGFRKNGELMLRLTNKGLVSYNIDIDRYTILKSCSNIPFPFVGSLISLKSAYGDREVVGTSGFGNPFQAPQWRTTLYEDEDSSD